MEFKVAELKGEIELKASQADLETSKQVSEMNKLNNQIKDLEAKLKAKADENEQLDNESSQLAEQV